MDLGTYDTGGGRQASFIRAILQGGGGVWVGGSKALDPHPCYNFEGFLGWAPATPSFFGHRSLVLLFASALFCFVVVQVAGVQVAIFQMADLLFDNILNLWTFCCTKLSELVRSPVVKVHDCSSSDPWFKLWDCKVSGVSPFGDA